MSVAGSLTLVVSRFPENLSLECKNFDQLPNSLIYTLLDGTMLIVYLHCLFTLTWISDTQKVFMKFKNVSILTCKAAIEFLGRYVGTQTSESGRNVPKFSLADLKNGVTSESETALQQILKRSLAIKRWKLIKLITCTFRNIYYRFLQHYYLLDERGYHSARNSFETMRIRQEMT